jgi:UDP-N-acetylmuramoyl-L-alanyl-D-glutamate--2,6-diaminopimelate ligase
MTKMRLQQIINGIAISDRRGRLDCEILGITSDSREVAAGHLFVAIKGAQADGHEHVHEALKRGASAVLAESWPESCDDGQENLSDVILVSNSRRAIALSAANYYGQPSRKLLMAGVTGTNGKTTVTYILESIMKAASRKVGVIGTLGHRYGKIEKSGTHTTPDAVKLQETLAGMRAEGITHVVMEVSSHALDQKRVAGVHFKVVGFTNLSQDHLDYHRDLDSYFQAKSDLFSDVLRKSRARGRMAVVNVDDPKGDALLEKWGGKSLRVSSASDSSADIHALKKELSLKGMKLTVRTPKGVWDLECPLVGEHNVSNVLVAMGMALAMGFSRARIERGLKNLNGVPGRLQEIENEDGKHVFVDYAHTPDALRNVLASLRPLFEGKLIVVFGCGGDRDQDKRSQMGAAVAEAADLAVLTNDNPRSEDPDEIAKSVEVGLCEGGWSASTSGDAKEKTFLRQLDRREAIRAAIEWASEGDLVLIAGKGHESKQIIGNETILFSDVEEARCILAGLPPPAPSGESIPSVPGRETSSAEVAIGDIEEVQEDSSTAESANLKVITEEVELASIESVEEEEVEESKSGKDGPPEDDTP